MQILFRTGSKFENQAVHTYEMLCQIKNRIGKSQIVVLNGVRVLGSGLHANTYFSGVTRWECVDYFNNVIR